MKKVIILILAVSAFVLWNSRRCAKAQAPRARTVFVDSHFQRDPNLGPKSFQPKDRANSEAWREASNKLFDVSVETSPAKALERLAEMVFNTATKEAAQERSLILLDIDLPQALLDEGLENALTGELRRRIPKKPIAKQVRSDSDDNIEPPKSSLIIRLTYNKLPDQPIASRLKDGKETQTRRLNIPAGESIESFKAELVQLRDKPASRHVPVSETTTVTPHSFPIEPLPATKQKKETSIESGQLTLSIEGVEAPRSATISFINKPWVHHFDEYVSQRPHDFLVLGRSNIATSQTEAHSQAVKDAARVISHAIVQFRYPQQRQFWTTVELVTLHQLQQGRWIKDRFSQKLVRPYGEVWREAILVELSGNDITYLINQHQRATVNYRQRRVNLGASLGALFILSLLLYWGLNTWTKGYHRGKIATTLFVASFAGAITLFFAIMQC